MAGAGPLSGHAFQAGTIWPGARRKKPKPHIYGRNVLNAKIAALTENAMKIIDCLNYCAFSLIALSFFLFFPPSPALADDGAKSFRFGDIEIVALLDARNNAQPSGLLLTSPETVKEYVPSDSYPLVVSAFVAKLNGQTVLFDTGNGPGSGGKLHERLAQAGFPLEQIEAVAITHMHGDHVGGLLSKNGQAAFPKATVYIAQPESDFWLKEAKAKSQPQGIRAGAKRAAAALKPYQGRIKLFQFGEEILPGVRPSPALGHTPGHTFFNLSAGQDKVIVMGDIVHIAPVQLPRPDVAISFDVDPEAAVKARLEAFEAAAASQTPIVGMHLPFPGLGRISKDGQGFAFAPAEAEK
jgi:glyoxylase-like metal-dependent hydrolase (beta-lactamase superfamily II)